MKLTTSLTLLSLTAVTLPFIPKAISPVNACAIIDTTTQVAIRGDRTPAQQENSVTTGSDGNCFNNNVLGNTTQVGIGAGQIRQSNQADYFVGGGDINQTGLTTPTITVTPQTQVDVYSPAHDPNFLNHLRQ